MKKLVAIILSLCLMTAVFCVAVFAAEPASDVVIRVSALKKDGTTELIADYKNHVEGWEAAIDLAEDKKAMKNNGYDRVVVDLYADWTAVKGEFSNSGDGFNWDAIYFPEDVRVTLNMNGYTIDRAMTDWEYNGEVMYVDDDANVIINDGTITGGFSCNGAGGIHINGANVTLVDVNVKGNRVEDDDGAGIAVYGGATLTMKNGSISDNILDGYSNDCGAGIYVKDGTVVLENVTIQNNQYVGLSPDGAAICVAKSGDVTLIDCKVLDNGILDKEAGFEGSKSVIYASAGSSLTVKGTTFSGNGTINYDHLGYSSLIYAEAPFSVESCIFTGNQACYMIKTNQDMNVSDTTFTDNRANVFYGSSHSADKSVFARCTFNNNSGLTWSNYYSFYFRFDQLTLTFIDCNFGDSTFNDRNYATFVDSSKVLLGSMFNEGSASTVFSLLALAVSVASVVVIIVSNNKCAISEKQTVMPEENE